MMARTKKTKGGGAAVLEPTTTESPTTHDAPIQRPEAVFLPDVDVMTIKPSPRNPRVFREDAAFAELVESIRQQGVLQPIVLREKHDELTGERFEIIAGERRWRASLQTRATIPAMIYRDMPDDVAATLTVTENMHRDDLSPLEEASGVRTLLDQGRNLEDVAASLGKSRKWVARRASLTKLCVEFRKSIEDEKSPWFGLPVRNLELIARLPLEAQVDFFDSSAGSSWHIRNMHDFDQLSRQLGRMQQKLATARFDPRDANLMRGVGACTACPKRSSCNPDLFDMAEGKVQRGVAKDDRCLDPTCWEAKTRHGVAATVRKLVEQGHRVTVVSGLPGKLMELLGDTKNAIKLVQTHNYSLIDAKKSTDGAFPEVCGATGEVKWYVAPRQEAANKRAAAAVAAGEPVPEPEDPIAIKLGQLGWKRLCWVARELITRMDPPEGGLANLPEIITESSIRPGPNQVSALEVVFLACNYSTPIDRPLSEVEGQPRDWDSELAELLERSLVVIRGRLHRVMAQYRSQLSGEVAALCSILRIDYEELHRQAVEAIPIPKSWRKQAEAFLAGGGVAIDPYPAHQPVNRGAVGYDDYGAEFEDDEHLEEDEEP